MAIVKDNIFTSGVSGTIGKKMTLRIRKGKTIVGVKRGPNSLPPTDEQLAVQSRFIDAATFAKNAILDPVMKAAYQKAAKGGQSAFNAAFRDAALPPVIKLIDTSAYKGQTGDIITISAQDVLPPVSVKVIVLSQAGAELESGDALQDDNKRYWKYTVTAANAAMTGTVIRVEATDVPGNKGSREIIIS
ncbi:hypothetical protein [Chitinophaga pinensis]|uniref:Uncharacterized protein n=1 Tax=Chitinophaga pinensis TaxID=79329 RepID=A0A5C6LVI0_9BACT|nr:hypothetical protein [Chitinophaga pinensis]TWV99425.1 hypothetical protein FEF09_16935 [Chitinophaga pinensis]